MADSSNPCPICKGLGWLTKDVPVGDPEFGVLYPCRCKVQELEQKRGESLRQLSNLEHLSHMTFELFQPEGQALNQDQRRNLRNAFEHAVSYAREPHGWLVFRGGYGCGKTHLAAAIANYRIQRGYPVLFVVVPDLLDSLRATYAPSSAIPYDQRFEQIRTHPLLVLDDLGSQSSTSWATEKLFQIFNYRYNAKLPTVVTTNCDLEEIEVRIRSRLGNTDLVHFVVILAPDYRASGPTGAHADLSSLAWHGDQTFATFDADRREPHVDAAMRASLRAAYEAAQAFAQAPSGWLLFVGPYGCGKTHLAAAIANHYISSRQSALFVVVPDLLDHLRATFSPQSTISYDKLFEQVRKAPLLVLDDLGTESATSWAREKLFQIFNYRYNARLPTVITSAQPVQELDTRLQSRLLDLSRCQIYEINAPAYRGQAAPAAQPRRRRQY